MSIPVGGSTASALPSSTIPPHATINAEGKVTNVSSGSDGSTTTIINPPLSPEDLMKGISTASPDPGLASLAGTTINFPSAAMTQATSGAAVNLTTNDQGNVSTFTGADGISHSVGELPAQFQSLTPSGFAAAVGNVAVGQLTASQSSLIAGLQNQPYGVSHVGDTSTSDSITSATTSTVVNLAPGATLGPDQVDMLPPPSTGIKGNPYMQPSTGAAVTALLIAISYLKRDSAKLEDQAIQNGMQATMVAADAKADMIREKYAAERTEASGALTSGIMSVVGSATTLVAMRSAMHSYQRNIKDPGGQETQTVNNEEVVPTTAASTTAATTTAATTTAATATAATTTAAPPPSATSTADTPSSGSVSTTDPKTSTGTKTVEEEGEHEESRAEGGGGTAVVGIGSGSSDTVSLSGTAETAHTPAQAHGSSTSSATAVAADASKAATTADTTQTAKKAATVKADDHQAAQDQIKEGLSPKEKAARVDYASSQFRHDVDRASHMGQIFQGVGAMGSSTAKIIATSEKATADVGQAYIDAFSQINSTWMQQLSNDRNQIDQEFRGSLDVAKQLMQQETQLQGQLFSRM